MSRNEQPKCSICQSVLHESYSDVLGLGAEVVCSLKCYEKTMENDHGKVENSSTEKTT